MRLVPKATQRAWRWVLAVLAVGAVPHRCTELPPECQQDWWQEFFAITSQICSDSSTCMNHPLIAEKATACLIQALPWTDAACLTGLGSAAAFMLRSLSSRIKSVALVDVVFDSEGRVSVDLALSVWDNIQEKRFPLDFSFAPFPYNVRTLVPFRVRTWHALAQLYSGAAKVLTESGIPHFAWLGAMRFWSELVGGLGQVKHAHPSLFQDSEPGLQYWGRMMVLPTQEYTMDIMVPAEMEGPLLRLSGAFELHGHKDPLERFFIHSVARGRLAQIVTNNFPEFGEGVDVRHICSNCVVMNVYFYSYFERPGDSHWLNVTAESPPCSVGWPHVFPLARMDDIQGFPTAFRGQIGAGLMPHQGLHLLAHAWSSYFGEQPGAPCFWDSGAAEAAAAVVQQAELGPVSAFLMRDLKKEDLGARPQEASPAGAARPGAFDGAAQGLPLVLAVTDFSQGILELRGVRGWFDFMERRMGAERPGLQAFQMKIWMKRLMQERDVPIPRLLHTSEDSPLLPFEGPGLPRIRQGYCVKPAHLAESHHTFAISPEGINTLTREEATLEEVQGNISFAWGRGLGDYDRTEGMGCATSGVHAPYLEGRPCTNWALYSSPPGLVIEELALPSPFYANFQDALLKQRFQPAGEPPDEIKCHVVWGQVFVAEWVTPKLMLGYIFRHGFVKSTIVISPEYQRTCYGGERIDGPRSRIGACNLRGWWERVVEVAEKAVPKGVDYMRVDVFPNGEAPVVNELSVAGYSTLLEDWMLKELLRRVQEGYRWRGVRPRVRPPAAE